MKITISLKELDAIKRKYKDEAIYTSVDFEKGVLECEVPDELAPVIILGHLMRLRREEMEAAMLNDLPTPPLGEMN